jgi:hypothetical protein
VYDATHEDFTYKTPESVSTYLYNKGAFMLFPEPSNNSKGAKKIVNDVKITILDIVPSTTSRSLYAKVIVTDYSTNSEKCGYVSLRAAAFEKAIVKKVFSYIDYEGFTKTDAQYSTIIKIDDNDYDY